MTNDSNPHPRLDAELLEMSKDLRGTLLSGATADAIGARIARPMESLSTGKHQQIAEAKVPPEFAHLDGLDLEK